jgi:nitroreductase
MELIEVIKGRRSIRSFEDRPIPRAMVEAIIEAGIWAPSAKNGQQWRFTVLAGKAKKELTDTFNAALDELIEKRGFEESGSATYSCEVMEEAPVIIIVWNAGEMGWESEIHSVAAAIQNMLLRAYDLGLGSLWIADIFHAPEAIKKRLGKPWKLTAAIALGYPKEKGRVPSKMGIEEVAEFYWS